MAEEEWLDQTYHKPLARQLAARGLDSFRFDFRANHESPGNWSQSNFDDASSLSCCVICLGTDSLLGYRGHKDSARISEGAIWLLAKDPYVPQYFYLFWTKSDLEQWLGIPEEVWSLVCTSVCTEEKYRISSISRAVCECGNSEVRMFDSHHRVSY
jgi:hypothetical protein